MYPQMVYHADMRAREKELAAAERGMGCSCAPPLGRMISRFIRKCNGTSIFIHSFELDSRAMKTCVFVQIS